MAHGINYRTNSSLDKELKEARARLLDYLCLIASNSGEYDRALELVEEYLGKIVVKCYARTTK